MSFIRVENKDTTVPAVVKPRKVSVPTGNGPGALENRNAAQTRRLQNARSSARGHDPAKSTIWDPYA